MKHTKTARRLALATLLLGLGASCSSTPGRHGEFRGRLAEAAVSLDGGAPETAHGQLVALMADMAAEDPKAGYGLQRYAAQALLLRTHASASGAGAFLTEPDRFDFSLSAGAGEGRQPSPTAHDVAAVYHAWNVIEPDPPAPPAGMGVDDVLPPALASLAVDSRGRTLGWLVVAASLEGLGFEDKAQRIAEQVEHPDLGRVFVREDPRADEQLVQALTDLGVPAPQQQRLLRTAFEIHRARFDQGGRVGNPTQAYRLGCLAAFGPLGPRPGTPFQQHVGTTDEAFTERFYGWVQDLGAEAGTFRSSSQTELRRGVRSCDLSGEPAIDFVWSRR